MKAQEFLPEHRNVWFPLLFPGSHVAFVNGICLGWRRPGEQLGTETEES